MTSKTFIWHFELTNKDGESAEVIALTIDEALEFLGWKSADLMTIGGKRTKAYVITGEKPCQNQA